jgi:hypothetical protein
MAGSYNYFSAPWHSMHHIKVLEGRECVERVERERESERERERERQKGRGRGQAKAH